MYRKYFAWSFDDGLEQDRRIIEILKKYDMGATFHLNSGLFGERTYEGRIGNLGMTEMPASRYEKGGWHLLPYAEHFRLSEDEAGRVYAGYEIASHGCHHVNLAKCSEEERRREIEGDVQALSHLSGRPVEGFAYPYGMGAGKCREALKAAGIRYARTVASDPSFRFPKDPYAMPLSCWHVSKKTFQTLDAFFRMEPGEDDLFFLMFAHGYEFDFGTRESNWEKMEKICERVSKHTDIICCSVGEALREHERHQAWEG